MSVGVALRAGCRLMPRNRQDARNVCEMNALPWSQTMVSGTITGRAAACSSRASMSTSRWCGSTEAAIRSASLQPGRIGSAVTARASNTDASTALVDGRNTAAVIDRVATSTRAVSSTRAVTPSSSSTITSNGVESICIISPGAVTPTCENADSGRAASDRRARAVPVVCRPRDSRANSR
ncbi:hypothetical protein [Dactylosporangium sp. NPDC005555]|uniref:hypothetical protein n=1 Tax=Dactylosporangium sp. NPDC005555 TaxID=3154889 RepID=UPI0033B4D970